MIYKLSDKNCTKFDTVFSTGLSNFQIEKFQKDFPPPKPNRQKGAFKKGDISFQRVFVIKEKKGGDYHVHSIFTIASKGKNKRLFIEVHFCKGSAYKNNNAKNKLKHPPYYWDDFFVMLKKYIVNLAKVDGKSKIQFVFSKKNFMTSLELPFGIELLNMGDEIGDMQVSGLRFSLKHSKVGIENVFVKVDDNSITTELKRVTKKIDENYFDSVLKLASTYVKLFVKEI